MSLLAVVPDSKCSSLVRAISAHQKDQSRDPSRQKMEKTIKAATLSKKDYSTSDIITSDIKQH